MNGKGDKNRVSNFKSFKENFQQIDWTNRRDKEEAKLMAEDQIPSFPLSSVTTDDFRKSRQSR